MEPIDRDPPIDCPRCHRTGRCANGARFGLGPICVRCYQSLYRQQQKETAQAQRTG